MGEPSFSQPIWPLTKTILIGDEIFGSRDYYSHSLLLSCGRIFQQRSSRRRNNEIWNLHELLGKFWRDIVFNSLSQKKEKSDRRERRLNEECGEFIAPRCFAALDMLAFSRRTRVVSLGLFLALGCSLLLVLSASRRFMTRKFWGSLLYFINCVALSCIRGDYYVGKSVSHSLCNLVLQFKNKNILYNDSTKNNSIIHFASWLKNIQQGKFTIHIYEISFIIKITSRKIRLCPCKQQFKCFLLGQNWVTKTHVYTGF